jgi:hypothetical protein
MKTKLLFLVLFLVSCDVADFTGPSSLKIQNTGNIDFQSVKISFTGHEVNYGALAAGEISEYKLFEEVYHYGFIEVEAEDTTYRLVPIDYVGESPLKSGQYTYEVKIEESSLQFKFIP